MVSVLSQKYEQESNSPVNSLQQKPSASSRAGDFPDDDLIQNENFSQGDSEEKLTQEILDKQNANEISSPRSNLSRHSE